MNKINKNRLMKRVIERIGTTNLCVFHSDVQTLFSEYSPKQKSDVFFTLKELCGDNLLSLDMASGCDDTNGIYRIRVTEYGLGYSSRKHDENISAIKNWTANLGVAFLGAVLGWLLSLLTMFLTGQIGPS